MLPADGCRLDLAERDRHLPFTKGRPVSNRLIALLLTALCWSTATGAAEEAAGPRAPAEAFAALTAPDDLVVEQVLAEPTVRQPVFLNFDDRGRMWVVEYLQY